MRFWPIIFILLVVFYIFHTQQSNGVADKRPILDRVMHPLDSRVRYRIGQVDPRFGVSRDELAQLCRQATAIWEEGTGKATFVEDEDAVLAVNLIYDERQAESTLKLNVEDSLNHAQADQQQHASQYQHQKQQLERERRDIDLRESSLQQRYDNYNRTVENWRVLGNIDDYNRQLLNQQRMALDTEQQELQLAIAQFNQHVDEVNRNAQQLNQQVNDFNQSVAEYRRRFRPRQFEKGIYNGRQINIYEFSSPAELRIVLAHEFGHALGLKHNNAPYALMYPMLQDQDITHFKLTAADKAMLAR